MGSSFPGFKRAQRAAQKVPDFVGGAWETTTCCMK